MTWEIFIKWLPSFIDGAWLTLQLVGGSSLPCVHERREIVFQLRI